MQSHYEKILLEQGEAAAKEYMRSLRLKRKDYSTGLNFKKARVQRKAQKTREKNREASPTGRRTEPEEQ